MKAVIRRLHQLERRHHNPGATAAPLRSERRAVRTPAAGKKSIDRRDAANGPAARESAKSHRELGARDIVAAQRLRNELKRWGASHANAATQDGETGM